MPVNPRPIPWSFLTAFYGEGVIREARWVGEDLEVETERGRDLWPEGDVEAVYDAMTRIATEFRDGGPWRSPTGS
jgi:hypothetical protein